MINTNWIPAEYLKPLSFYTLANMPLVRYQAVAKNGHWYTAEKLYNAVPKGAALVEFRNYFVTLQSINGQSIGACKSILSAKNMATRIGLNSVIIAGTVYRRVKGRWVAEEIDIDALDMGMM